MIKEMQMKASMGRYSQVINFGKDVDREELLHTADGNVT